jgi:hypothetical protein
MRLLCSLVFILLLTSTVFVPIVFLTHEVKGLSLKDDFYFGVTFGGTTLNEAKILIDEVKGYTNLFVVDNWDVALNETLLTEICDYAVNADLNVIVYFSFIFFNSTQLSESRLELFKESGIEPFHVPWLSRTWERWGDKFLGAYVLDEPGGNQIEVGNYHGFTTQHAGRNVTTFEGVANYTDSAYRFVRGLGRYYVQRLNDPSRRGSIPNATGRVIPVFTADYALYWFDYLAGYDVVLVELGWDHNQIQHIGLCRGAANVQDKDWGAIITWATNDPPYLMSGEDMLRDMNTAYYSGAKYVVVFNYPLLNPYGALDDEHFDAMKTFWARTHAFSRRILGTEDGEVAFVLPKDYGWAMRYGQDNIWGIWPADDLVPVIGEKVASLLDIYGSKLDIIYDDPQFNYTEKYQKIYYWNGTTSFLSSSSSNMQLITSGLSGVVIITIVVMISILFYSARRRNLPSDERTS